MPLSASDALPNYFAVFKGERLPLYLQCRSRKVDVELNAPSERLWEEHDRVLKSVDGKVVDHEEVFPSLLDLKLELAKRHIFNCRLCERNCGVDRSEKKGFCRVTDSRVASKFVHYGEEPELVPSYTIFFSGCTFHCIFCQNWDISQNEVGAFVEPEKMAFDIERKSGVVRNVNWVGGEPTPNLPYILEVMNSCSARMPQVWNSNMYMSSDAMRLLDGFADLYLSDFKYGNDECAHRLSKVKDYFQVVSRNHKLANEQCETIIRHLVMPNHVECCSKPVLDWISENLDMKRVRVNVMDQYRPEYRADEAEEMRSRLDLKEFYRAYDHAKSLGLNLVD